MIGLAFVLVGIFAFLGYLLPMRNIVGIISMTLGMVLLTIFAILLPILIKKDRIKYDTNIAKLNKEVDEICDRIITLKGGKDGK